MASSRRLLLPVALLLTSASASADWSLHVEGGGASHLSTPQRDYFGLGFGGVVAGSLGLASMLDVTLQAGYLFLPRLSTSPLSGNGTSLTAGPGLRLHRPLEVASVVPAVDAAVLYVRTGSVNRVGFTAGAALMFRLGEGAPFWLGLFARVQYVLNMQDQLAFPTSDATVASFGVAFDYTSEAPPPDRDGDAVPDFRDDCPTEGTLPVTERGCPVRVASPPTSVVVVEHEAKRTPVDTDGDGVNDSEDACPADKGPAATKGCPDTDGDTVIDRIDVCPKAPGRPEDGGCPRYSSIVVTSTKIELKQKIFFAFGQDTILPKSYPLLDEVTQALKDRGTLCARIEGHTDGVGSAPRNLKLSDDRAAAVRKYLVGRGIDQATLLSKGYGQTLPLESNATPEGREINRRVEFVIIPCSEARQ